MRCYLQMKRCNNVAYHGAAHNVAVLGKVILFVRLGQCTEDARVPEERSLNVNSSVMHEVLWGFVAASLT